MKKAVTVIVVVLAIFVISLAACFVYQRWLDPTADHDNNIKRQNALSDDVNEIETRFDQIGFDGNYPMRLQTEKDKRWPAWSRRFGDSEQSKVYFNISINRATIDYNAGKQNLMRADVDNILKKLKIPPTPPEQITGDEMKK